MNDKKRLVIFNKITSRVSFHEGHLQAFIREIGINKLSPADLVFLQNNVEKELITMKGFAEYYAIAASNRSNKVMIWLTIIIGGFTAIAAIATVAHL